jgi:hypothetical protein
MNGDKKILIVQVVLKKKEEMSYLKKGMAGYNLIQPTDLRYNCPPSDMRRIYQCVEWEIIRFGKETKSGKGIVIGVWKAKKMSQEVATLIAGEAWRRSKKTSGSSAN